MFHNLLSGKVSEIANLYDHYSGLFEEAEQGIGNLLLDKIGGPDNVAGLFEFGDYDLAGWISDYIDDEAGLITRSAGTSPDVTRAACHCGLLPAHGRQQHPERR